MFEERVVEIPNGTSRNKNLIVYAPYNSSLFAVKWKNGGELPAALDQRWTSREKAVEAINRWQDKQGKKPPAPKKKVSS